MIAPRWHKVLRDLWSNKVRTLLVILTIGVGVFAVGFVSNSFPVVLSDMNADYASVNPHGAIILTQPFDNDYLHSLEKVPGVGAIEGRSAISGNMLAPDGKKISMSITGIPPMDQIKVDQIRAVDPVPAPELKKGDIYVEKSILTAVPLKIGQDVEVEMGEGLVRRLHIAGFVNDVGTLAYMFTQTASAYANAETIEWLGGPTNFNRIVMTVSENQTDEAHVRTVADAVAEKIKESGQEVYFTLVFRPGRHPASDITAPLGVMMSFFGALAVFLSTFLVINTINSLLAQHVRQIGVMKAVGARTGQLIAMYLVLVICFGLLALAIAAPLAAWLGYGVSQGIAGFLNFRLGPFRFLPSSLALQAGVALLVPIGAAMLPVLRGTRVTIREAISSYGLSRGKFGRSLIDRLVESVRFLPRPLLISLRNTFRRKARLLLTLSSLTLAGAIFISVFNLRASMNKVIGDTLGYILSDVNVGFSQFYRSERLIPMARSVPGVVSVEGWISGVGQVLTEDGTTSTQIQFLAPPANTTLVKPVITSGRWLLPEDENGIVIGNHLLAARPELKVGDVITLDIDNRESDWHIVGIYQMAGTVIPPIVYANYEYMARELGSIGRVAELRIVTNQHDLAFQQQTGKSLEDLFKRAGIQVGGIVYGADLVNQNKQTTDILIYFLLVMASLIALVGGLGLMSTMGMNVIERTREIGVIRAIGASDGSVLQLVIVEGMLIGILSWILGAILAVPIGMLLGYAVGMAFLFSPLPFLFSMDGFLVWLVIVLVLSALASFVPARNASRLTVREVLSYE